MCMLYDRILASRSISFIPIRRAVSLEFALVPLASIGLLTQQSCIM